MKIRSLQLTLLCLCLLAFRAAATTYYVDVNSPDPMPPYNSWGTAATNIQDAIAQTVNGDSVLVNPGIYTAPLGSGTAINVTNAITIQGLNGPAETSINGNNSMGCVYLTGGATLIGFTLENGHAYNGGGVYCASTAGTIISNCVITANMANGQGGGAWQGTYWNCSVSQNFGPQYGGGTYDAVLINCQVISNSLIGNYAEGAGVYNSEVTNSVIADNSAPLTAFGSEGGGAFLGNLDHCNITGNSSDDGGGTFQANLVNCINYNNIWNTNGGSPYSSNYDGGTINYTCTAGQGFPPGTKDITSDPQLASFSHISLGSPCRSAGIAAASSGVDIDGNPWANPPSMGCFEPYPGSVTGSLAVAVSAPFTNWAPGFTLNLQANISGPVYSNVWNLGDGTFVTNEAFVSHEWAAPGTYPVTLTAYNDSYPGGVTATLPINVAVPSVYYVNLNSGNPVPPYITWATAAVNIEDAVSIAAPGSVVLVTNGPTARSPQNGELTNTAAFYMSGSATAPDHNVYHIVITNAITVESVNGPATTYISGVNPAGNSAKIAYLANGAILSGFTLTNFSQISAPGEIWATSTSAVITNCLLTEYVTVNSGTLNNCTLALHSSSANSTLNSCTISNNSMAIGGILNNCLLLNNTNSGGDGGAAMAEQGYPLVLNNCLISNNVAGFGAGVYNTFLSTPTYYTNCILNNCTLTRNLVQNNGGVAYGAELNNCLISSNQTSESEGCAGIEGGLAVNCTIIGNSNGAAVDGDDIFPREALLTNCTLVGNLGATAASYSTLDQCSILQNTGSGAINCTLNQCTIMQNAAGASASALDDCLIISNVPPRLGAPTEGAGANDCTLTNCILAYNVATNGGAAYRSTLVNCTVTANTGVSGGGIYDCTADNCILYYNNGGDYYPAATSQYPLNYCCAPVPGAYGIRNITSPPLFVNLVGGDYHLQSTSPCINSGNNTYITDTIDLDGNPRVQGSTVDIGAYEYQTPTSMISYAYLQQYGLPTDGSVDFADLDGTAFNVYQDWIAGLNPTNSASVLAMLTPVTTNTATGVTLTWQSVSGIPYFLQRSTNLATQPPFSTIQSNITGQTSITSYTDATATNNVPYFYRVGVVAP